MSLGVTESPPFPGLISVLDIDADKDWGGFGISNMAGGLSVFSSDIIVNGGFDSDTDWTKTGDAIISGGVATFGTLVGGETGTWAPQTPLTITSGQTYLLILDANIVNGSLDVSVGGYSIPQVTSAAGTLSYVFTASTTDNLLITGVVTGGKKTAWDVDNVVLQPSGVVSGAFEVYDLMLMGAFKFGGDNLYDIGEDGVGVKRIFLGEPSGSYSLPNFTGLTATYTGGDMYIGNDNVYPGYYVQKTVLHGSVVSDNSEDFTNLYQGDSGYQRLALMYDIPWNASNRNGLEFSATEQDTCRFYWGSSPFIMYREGSNSKFVLDGETEGTHAFLELALNHLTEQEAFRPDTTDKIDLGDSANSLLWRQGHFSQGVYSGDGFYVSGTQVVGTQQAGIADAVTAHAITDPADSPADADVLRDDLVANAIPDIESALNALGTKINSIITALEVHGLLATV